MQFAANSVACRTPSHDAGDSGALHRSAPTGGAADGIPLYTRTSGFLPGVPETSPLASLIGSPKTIEAVNNIHTTRFMEVSPARDQSTPTRSPDSIRQSTPDRVEAAWPRSDDSTVRDWSHSR